jgi:hypothetical protein
MAGFSVWIDGAGIDVYIDWSWITMKEFSIELGAEGMFCEFQFGFKIYPNGRSGDQITVVSQPEPIFASDDRARRNPRSFEQKFEGEVYMKYMCDDSLDNQTIAFDSFLLDKDGCVFRVLCPQVREFAVTHPGSVSPLFLTRSPIHEL